MIHSFNTRAIHDHNHDIYPTQMEFQNAAHTVMRAFADDFNIHLARWPKPNKQVFASMIFFSFVFRGENVCGERGGLCEHMCLCGV